MSDDNSPSKEGADFFDDDFFDRWDFEQDIHGLSPPPEEVIGPSPKGVRRHIYDVYVPNWHWGQVDLSRWDRSRQINVLRYRVSGNIQYQQIDLEDEYGPNFIEAIQRTASQLRKLDEDELDRQADPGKSAGDIVREVVDLIALRTLAWMRETNASKWAIDMYQHVMQEAIRNVVWGSYREVDA